MKHVSIFDPATCERFDLYFDFAEEVENTRCTWISTAGYTSLDPITGDEEERIDKLAMIASGKTKSYWLKRNGGDYDAASDIHEVKKGDIHSRQFIKDFKKVCGFYPKFKD